MLKDIQLILVNTYLFGIVDTLQVKGGYVGAVKRFSKVLFVAGEDLALQVRTHRMYLIPPVGVRRGEKYCENGGKYGVNRKVGWHRGNSGRGKQKGRTDSEETALNCAMEGILKCCHSTVFFFFLIFIQCLKTILDYFHH